MRGPHRTVGRGTLLLMVGVGIVGLGLAMLPRHAGAGEVVLLKDGQAIQADRTEVIGDRVRIQRPTGEIELPRSSVLTILPVAPQGTGAGSSPAAVYPGFTQEMNERVRQDLQQGRSPARP